MNSFCDIKLLPSELASQDIRVLLVSFVPLGNHFLFGVISGVFGVEAAIESQTLFREAAVGQGGFDGAAGLGVVATVTEAALRFKFHYVSEGFADAFTRVCNADFSHTGSVNNRYPVA